MRNGRHVDRATFRLSGGGGRGVQGCQVRELIDRSIRWCVERELELELPAPQLAFAKLEAGDSEIINFHDPETTSEISIPSKLDAIGASWVSLGHLRGLPPKNKSFSQATGSGQGLCAPLCSIRGRTRQRG